MSAAGSKLRETVAILSRRAFCRVVVRSRRVVLRSRYCDAALVVVVFIVSLLGTGVVASGVRCLWWELVALTRSIYARQIGHVWAAKR